MSDSTEHSTEQQSSHISELTDLEKDRIRLEETYRYEIRSRLDEKRSKGANRVIAFLQTSLGLWLLSSLTVGLLSWAYTQYQDNKTHEKERLERINKIDSEMKTRLRIYKASLEAMKVGAYDGGNPIYGLYLREHNRVVNTTYGNEQVKDYTPTLDLLIDLSSLLRDDREKQEINGAIKAWILLLDNVRVMTLESETTDRNFDLKDFIGRREAEEKIVAAKSTEMLQLLEKFRLSRWAIDANQHALDLYVPVQASPDIRVRAGLFRGDLERIEREREKADGNQNNNR